MIRKPPQSSPKLRRNRIPMRVHHPDIGQMFARTAVFIINVGSIDKTPEAKIGDFQNPLTGIFDGDFHDIAAAMQLRSQFNGEFSVIGPYGDFALEHAICTNAQLSSLLSSIYPGTELHRGIEFRGVTY